MTGSFIFWFRPSVFIYLSNCFLCSFYFLFFIRITIYPYVLYSRFNDRWVSWLLFRFLLRFILLIVWLKIGSKYIKWITSCRH